MSDISYLIFLVNPAIEWGPNGRGDYNTGDLALDYSRIEHRVGPRLPTLAQLQTKESDFLEVLRVDAKRDISQAAEVARRNDLTLPGKVWELERKNDEYDRWIIAGEPPNPSADAFPLSEVERKEFTPNKTIVEMLTEFRREFNIFLTRIQSITPLERRGHLAMDSTTDESEIKSVRDAAVASLEVL